MNEFKNYRGRGRGSFQYTNHFRGTMPHTFINDVRRPNSNNFSPLLPFPQYRENKPRWHRLQNPTIWRSAPRISHLSYVRPFVPQPSIQKPCVDSRPISPLPGSEEARQKVIAEASARIKEQLNLTENDKKYDEKETALKSGTSGESDDCSIINELEYREEMQYFQKTPDKNLKKKVKKQANSSASNIEELQKKILTQFTYMSKGKIQNLVNNPGSSRYDSALHHLVRDMRLHLSSELRNMYNNRETDYSQESNEMIDHFNSIVPDLGVELVSLPDTMVAELSKILQFDVNNDLEETISVSAQNETALVEPEDMFKQAEELLSNTEYLNSTFDASNSMNQQLEITHFPEVSPYLLSENNKLNTMIPVSSEINKFAYIKSNIDNDNNDPFLQRSPIYNCPPPNLNVLPHMTNFIPDHIHQFPSQISLETYPALKNNESDNVPIIHEEHEYDIPLHSSHQNKQELSVDTDQTSINLSAIPLPVLQKYNFNTEGNSQIREKCMNTNKTDVLINSPVYYTNSAQFSGKNHEESACKDTFNKTKLCNETLAINQQNSEKESLSISNERLHFPSFDNKSANIMNSANSKNINSESNDFNFDSVWISKQNVYNGHNSNNNEVCSSENNKLRSHTNLETNNTSIDNFKITGFLHDVTSRNLLINKEQENISDCIGKSKYLYDKKNTREKSCDSVRSTNDYRSRYNKKNRKYNRTRSNSPYGLDKKRLNNDNESSRNRISLDERIKQMIHIQDSTTKHKSKGQKYNKQNIKCQSKDVGKHNLNKNQSKNKKQKQQKNQDVKFCKQINVGNTTQSIKEENTLKTNCININNEYTFVCTSLPLIHDITDETSVKIANPEISLNVSNSSKMPAISSAISTPKNLQSSGEKSCLLNESSNACENEVGDKVINTFHFMGQNHDQPMAQEEINSIQHDICLTNQICQTKDNVPIILETTVKNKEEISIENWTNKTIYNEDEKIQHLSNVEKSNDNLSESTNSTVETNVSITNLTQNENIISDSNLCSKNNLTTFEENLVRINTMDINIDVNKNISTDMNSEITDDRMINKNHKIEDSSIEKSKENVISDAVINNVINEDILNDNNILEFSSKDSSSNLNRSNEHKTCEIDSLKENIREIIEYAVIEKEISTSEVVKENCNTNEFVSTEQIQIEENINRSIDMESITCNNSVNNNKLNEHLIENNYNSNQNSISQEEASIISEIDCIKQSIDPKIYLNNIEINSEKTKDNHCVLPVKQKDNKKQLTKKNEPSEKNMSSKPENGKITKTIKKHETKVQKINNTSHTDTNKIEHFKTNTHTNIETQKTSKPIKICNEGMKNTIKSKNDNKLEKLSKHSETYKTVSNYKKSDILNKRSEKKLKVSDSIKESKVKKYTRDKSITKNEKNTKSDNNKHNNSQLDVHKNVNNKGILVNGDQAVLNRLLEIDLKINKLMQEKWILYKQLNLSNYENTFNKININSDSSKINDNKNCRKRKISENTSEFSINENIRIRQLSVTPSESSLSDVSTNLRQKNKVKYSKCSTVVLPELIISDNSRNVEQDFILSNNGHNILQISKKNKLSKTSDIKGKQDNVSSINTQIEQENSDTESEIQQKNVKKRRKLEKKSELNKSASKESKNAKNSTPTEYSLSENVKFMTKNCSKIDKDCSSLVDNNISSVLLTSNSSNMVGNTNNKNTDIRFDKKVVKKINKTACEHIVDKRHAQTTSLDFKKQKRNKSYDNVVTEQNNGDINTNESNDNVSLILQNNTIELDKICPFMESNYPQEEESYIHLETMKLNNNDTIQMQIKETDAKNEIKKNDTCNKMEILSEDDDRPLIQIRSCKKSTLSEFDTNESVQFESKENSPIEKQKKKKLEKRDIHNSEVSNKSQIREESINLSSTLMVPCFVQLQRLDILNINKKIEDSTEAESTVTKESIIASENTFISSVSLIDSEENILNSIETFKIVEDKILPSKEVEVLEISNNTLENTEIEIQDDLNSVRHLNSKSTELGDNDIFCMGHQKSILDIKIIGDEFLAASEDGTIYKYCIKTGNLQDAYTGHKRAVTCIFVVHGNILDINSTLLYSGSLDCTLKCHNIDTAEILHSVTVEQAIQCLDSAWGYIFLGTYEGLLFIYNIKKKQLHDHSLTIANATVLMIKATQEGSRQVLILASRKREIMVRDAFTGLLLRTMCHEQTPTIYSLLLDRSLVYCGTSDKGILILDFNNGMQTGTYNSGKGVVCMLMYQWFLFAGCYDGMIYVYNTRTQKHVTTIPGPGDGMLLSLAINDGVIVAGTKKDHLLKIWKIPQEIFNECK